MKKTAVDWLYEEIWKQFNFSFSSNILEKAKEMEKQQIIDAYYEGKEYGFKEHGEEYYNETYENKENI